MAERKEEGTGKHPHKSTEEPYPHHEGKTTKGREETSEGRGEESGRAKHAAAGVGSGSQSEARGKESESSDLKKREYRDKEGNIHHHTRTYEEQHGKEK